MKLNIGRLILAAFLMAVIGAAAVGLSEAVLFASKGQSYSVSLFFLIYGLMAAVAFPICLLALALGQVIARKLGILDPPIRAAPLVVLGALMGTALFLPLAAALTWLSHWWMGAVFGTLGATVAYLILRREAVALK